jgi:hypothetical protein
MDTNLDKQVQADLDDLVCLTILGRWSTELHRKCQRISALIEHGNISNEMRQNMIVHLRNAEKLIALPNSHQA